MYGTDTVHPQNQPTNQNQKKKRNSAGCKVNVFDQRQVKMNARGRGRGGWGWGRRYVHVWIGLLPGCGGRERARAACDCARRGKLDDARVVPRCVCAGVRGVGAPVDERERAADVGDEEVLGRRGVRADRAQRVRERDHVGGRLRARVSAARLAVVAAGAVGGGRGRERRGGDVHVWAEVPDHEHFVIF